MNGLQRPRNNNGMTFVEILISLFLVTTGIMGSMLYLTTAKAGTALAQDLTIATNHAGYILEDMTTRTTLADITSTDWIAFASGAGLNTLSNEAITVAFADTLADPLNITVTVDWQTNTRPHSISMITEMTR